MNSHPSSRMPLVRSILSMSTALILGFAAVASAQVTPVQVITDPVQGRAPVVNLSVQNLTRPGVAPSTGYELQATATATDPDGDTLLPTEYKWLRNSTQVHVGATYVPGSPEVLTVEASVNTDPAVTGPTQGVATSTVTVTANRAPIFTSAPSPNWGGIEEDVLASDADTKYSDSDGDAPGSHVYEWYKGPSMGAAQQLVGTGPTYTPTVVDAGWYLSLKTVPKALTGAPSIGTIYGPAPAPYSQFVNYYGAIVINGTGVFSRPLETHRANSQGVAWSSSSSARGGGQYVAYTWRDAATHCAQKRPVGAWRLPTRQQLQTLFSSGSANLSQWQWPKEYASHSYNMYYWSSTQNGTLANGVNFATGAVNTELTQSNLLVVSCIH